jgi:hypothetical protein
VPKIKSPAVVMGERALKAVEAEVCPVPPLAMPNVPLRVTTPVAAAVGEMPASVDLKDETPEARLVV